MNTLTGIEAERVNQILRHSLDRLQVLSYVPSTWDDEILSEMKTQAVVNSLEKQWLFEEQLRAIGESPSDANGKDLSVIRQAHRASKATCRNLQADRDSLQVLMSRPEVQSEEFSKFIKYLNELRSQVLNRMMTTVEDEAAHRSLLHELTERERQLEESRDTLQKKLDEVREEKERVTFSLDQTIRKLQLEIQDITQRNTFEMDGVHKEMSDAINKATADHELRMRQLQDQVDGLERQCNETMEKNREEELRLRKEKTRAETTLNAKIAQYDEDMQSRKKTLEEISTAFKEESREYALLKEYFDKVDADLSRKSDEEFILAAVRRKREFGMYILHKAATAIQKIARGVQGRQAVAKMKSKKGGKGKKGKK